jgi:hypothetical protein
MEILASPFEWYISETSSPTSPPLQKAGLQLGPFVTEEECRTVLETVKELPRFSHVNLELHKRFARQQKRTIMTVLEEIDRIRSADVLYWRRGQEQSRDARAEYHRRQDRLGEIRAGQLAEFVS